jgi:hypothetical protein
MDTEKKVYFDNEPVPDFSTLVQLYRDREFKSPYRSTVPLLSLFRDGQRILQEILAKCLMDPPNFHIEFTVAPPRGRGKAPHTDLMVNSESRCLAIEAKWTEPTYPTVSKWPHGKIEKTVHRRRKQNKSQRTRRKYCWVGSLYSNHMLDAILRLMNSRIASIKCSIAPPRLATEQNFLNLLTLSLHRLLTKRLDLCGLESLHKLLAACRT